MDCLVAGSGITGAVVARLLAEAGMEVVVVERRRHIAGNLYDFRDEHGILVQKYGPHAFHTNDENVFAFINRFGSWQDFRLTSGAVLDGVCSPAPFNFRTIDMLYPEDSARDLKERLAAAYPGKASVGILELLDSPDDAIRRFAKILYEKDYAPYTAKQWGIGPDEIDPSVLARVPVRLSYAEGYFDDVHQVLPADSYTDFIGRVLDHPNVDIRIGADALDRMKIADDRLVLDGSPFRGLFVYTGALDRLFGYEFGKLPYRSLRFEWHHDDQERLQPYPIVVYPQEPLFTRITEYKQLPLQKGSGTTYAVEFPIPFVEGASHADAEPDPEPYYPVPTEASARMYRRYREKVDGVPGLVCCGRLADFKYYNMDQAIRRALDVAESLTVARTGSCASPMSGRGQHGGRKGWEDAQ